MSNSLSFPFNVYFLLEVYSVQTGSVFLHAMLLVSYCAKSKVYVSTGKMLADPSTPKCKAPDFYYVPAITQNIKAFSNRFRFNCLLTIPGFQADHHCLLGAMLVHHPSYWDPDPSMVIRLGNFEL